MNWRTKLASVGLGLVSLPVWAMSGTLDPALLQAAERQPVSVLIEMQEQADLSAAQTRLSKDEKGAFVKQTLQSLAESSQQPVKALLQARGLEYRSFWVANAIHLKAGADDLRALAELDGIAAIHPLKEPEFSYAPPQGSSAKASTIEPGLSLVGAPAVWDLGVRGEGVVVGDHDIGVEWDHPALINQYRGWDGTQADHAYNWRNAFGATDLFCTDPEVPCDSHGHGTHTTGTMVGDDGAGRQIGMAPKAQWIACRSLYDPVLGLGTLPAYMDCMEWFIAPYPQGAPELADVSRAPDVVNNSWGCVEGCPPNILLSVNDATKAAGIVQVVSAGNDGSQCSTIAFPLAIYDSSFSVGATDFNDQMVGFSSRGPVLSDLSMRIKPNVVAPGRSITSSLPGGEYGSMSGTSMAGPHVAGLVALVISAKPELRGQVDAIRDIIERTAVPIETTQQCGGTGAADIPNNIFGFGRIDALAAVLEAAPELLEADGEAAAPAARSAATRAGGALGFAGLLILLPLLRRRRRA